VTKVYHETITAPALFASALINNDRSGLSGEESNALDLWLDREGIKGADFVGVGEPRFTWSFDLYCRELGCRGGEVADYQYFVVERGGLTS